MPGSPILAAHIAEITRQKKKKEAAAKKDNEKTATQKASSKNVTALVNKKKQSTGTSTPSKGILASSQSVYAPYFANNVVLAKRIAERKAVAQRNQGRYATTHGMVKKPKNNKLKATPNGIKQQHNQQQVENYGTAKNFVDNIGLMGKSLLHGGGKGSLNTYIEGSHYLDALYRKGGGDEAASGNIHKKVIAANKRSNEANNVGNPLDKFQDKYKKDTEKILVEAEKKGLDKTAGFMMGLGQSAATLPAFAIPGLGEAAVFFQTAGQMYDEAVSEGASEKDALLSATLAAIPTAVIERFGGGEKIASLLLKGTAPKKILSSIATSAFTEGLEESAQQVIASGAKSVYKDVPVFSTEEGKDAWINPGMIKDSFVAGALAGGILGGATTAVSVGLNKAVSKSSTEPLDSIETETRAKLDSGEITQQQADEVLKNVSTAKAVYEVSQAPTKEEAQARIDGFVSDGTLDEDQGRYVWQILTAEAKKNDEELPTSTEEQTVPEYKVGDVIQFDGEDAKVINIVEEDDGKKYFVDVNGEMDVITEDELTAEQQKIVSDTAIQQGSEEIPTQNKIDETDVDTAWNDLKEQYSTWRRGQAPQQINDTQIVSKFVDNALANIEDPAIREALKQRVLEGGLTHERYTDKHAQQDLANDRAILGEDAVNAQMEKDAAILKTVLAKKVVTGQIESLIDAINDGDASAALRVAQVLAETGTNLGQGVQAYSQLKKLTPAGRLLYAQQQLNADYNKKYGYAPEAVKADIEREVREELPSLIEKVLNEYEFGDAPSPAVNGKIDFDEAVKKGSLKETVLDLTRHVAASQNLDTDGVIDVYAALWEDINGRVIKYRESVIKNMITKTGKNKKRTYLQRLLEYNNIGAFDDPDAAALIINKMDLPFLTQEDFSFITEAAEKARQLPEGSREQQIEYNKINKLINKKKNYTVGQKIRVIQLTDMLLNVRTMERNVVPNVAMVAPNAIGDLFGTVLDKQIAKRTGQRTTGLPANPLDALKDAGTGVANVFRDTKDGIDTSLAGNRDNVPMGDMFSNKNPFGWTVNKASKAVTIGLQLGDRPFEEAYYNNSLRQQMRANNVSEPTELMKDIARITAIQRTWKDENIITKGFQFIQHDFLNGGKDFGVGNILLPFIKTPANLLKAIYDYSPAAAASIAVDISKFRKADPGSDAQIMAQFNLVNHTSKALGGTIIMAMAFALAKAGLIGITGAADDNYEREKYKEEVLGWQPYSIKIGDKYFSYAWTQPFSSFMGTGVDLYNNMQNTEYADDGFVDLLAKAFGDTFTMSGKMIYEQTVLQGISTLFGKDNPWQGLIEVATNAPQQFIPALVGQLAAAIDPYKRQTYVPGDFKGNVGRGILNKIPFASKMLPAKTNAMGEKLERFPGGGGTDALNAFLNPAQMSQIKSNDVTDEISRLEESTNEKLYPSSAKNAIEVGKETLNLTAKEKQAWNASVGGDFKKAVGKLIESDAYGNMSDSQKAAAISKIHEDLNAIYKYQFLSKKGYDVELDSAYKKVQEAEKLKISISDFVTIGTSLNVIDNDGKGDFSTRKRDYILNYGLNDKQTIFTLKAHNLISETAIANADDLEEHYGVDQSVFYKAWIECNRIASEYDGAGMSDYRIRKQREYIASLDDLSPEQKSQLDDRIVSDDIYIPNDKLIDYSGGVDSAILSAMSDTAQEAYSSGSKYVSTPISKMGLSASDFSWAYDYMNQADGKKKEDYAKRLNELNLPASTKSAILAARGYKPDYSFNNGGSVEIGSYGNEPKTNEAKALNETYTVSSNRNPVEKKRTTFSPLGGDFRVSSPWGPREAPIAGASTFHKGIDLAAPEGTPVIAIKNGTITRVSNGGGFGLSVEITFDDGSFAKYSHLSTESVNKGDAVKAGVQIGEVGQSGVATGPHLDFRYKADKNGDWVDPAKYFSFAGNAGATSGEYVPVRSAGSAKETTSSASNGSKSGGIGLRDSHVLASLIAKKRSSYSRYGYGGWPRYSYTGNENKTKS